MTKLTIEDLKQIKDKGSHIMALRTGKSSAAVTVHMGECGIAAGSREVMTALLDAKAASERADIKILAGGCSGECASEPNVTVQITGEPKATIYQKMDIKKINQVFQKHIIAGEVQKELVLQK